ncbi:hypothetical protein ALT_2593 [Aspergillus lentulus]|uniref:DUF1993 domain-containing protein n=1 Tax=Aspergillus lentulus TaxID=293939 RepID=A0AAN4T908_ASPLE|nr:uncharacterized protein IFM58399_06823 [Aspergillus lentulus]KAF4159575.1 hypothetical protein CNMCM6936_004330 [Aspergillus lentulus]KAF4160149.1 hypothetical protein CNMCM6069_009220 [Aspergillus lentulus]KAF4181435.1 hypothetical protein CNMCM7927_000671 [Aspergillus lentulus]KAF4181751.1 hypothetical protein CNMCM8060_008122 [Aspergillus lentulus]KAF4198205.1 hypothetical protein CNMCM8694_000889 [Aspergillus lentulus]
MTSSLYTYTVPTYLKGLETLTLILKKAEEYAKENNIPLSEFAEARLYPNMLPLSFQVQSVSNTSKNSVARLAGTENVSMEDNEKTFEEFYDRINRTIEVIKAVDPKLFEGKDHTEFHVKFGSYESTFTGETYVNRFGLPNFFFHLNMAYAILRSKGVPLGKFDYLKYFNA